jgi:cation diffusion facilitator CzcD-associated flavoprotein CzcO
MSFPPWTATSEVDVAVVGAGITGVTVAHLLEREGKSVGTDPAWRPC